ncbi:hypothetical protein C8F01DRAFT_1252166 [Mycena amicta]|nr:hypothetical protein C8F01DRAFT_1252166 [Mycena amicta]
MLRSLVAALPPDVLARIFANTAPSYQVTAHQWLPRHPADSLDILVHEHLIIAGDVCHAWRVVASSMPQLWTTVEVDLKFGRRITNSDRWYYEAVALHLPYVLARSGGLPLTLHLRIDSPSLCVRMVHQLLATAPRWKAVNIRMSGEAKNSRWIMGVAGNLPLLKSLRVNARDSMLLGVMPRLSTLYTDLPLPNFKSTALQTLYIHAEGRPSQVFHGLRRLSVFKNTLHLAVDLLPGDSLYSIRLPATTSFLTILHLTLWDWTACPGYATDVLNYVLPNLYLPRLQVLSILYYGRRHPVISPSVFLQFIKHSGLQTVLRVLILFNVAIGNVPALDSTAAWLSALPALVRLSLSDISVRGSLQRPGIDHPHGLVIDRTLLFLLSLRRYSTAAGVPHPPLLLPRLRHLTLNSHLDSAAFSGDDLRAFVKARRVRRPSMFKGRLPPFELHLSKFHGGTLEPSLRDAVAGIRKDKKLREEFVLRVTLLGREGDWMQMQSQWGEFWRVT